MIFLICLISLISLIALNALFTDAKWLLGCCTWLRLVSPGFILFHFVKPGAMLFCAMGISGPNPVTEVFLVFKYPSDQIKEVKMYALAKKAKSFKC